MGAPILCDNGCGNDATFMVTNLRTGESTALDDPCWMGFIRSMSEQLPAGPEEMPASEAVAAAAAAQEVEAGRRPSRPRRRQGGAQGAPHPLTAEASPFPDIAPDDS